MAMLDSSDEAGGAQTDGDGPDGSDKPPTADISNRMHNMSLHSDSSSTVTPQNGASAPTPTPTLLPKRTGGSYPLPPPDTLAAGEKQPGRTRGELAKLNGIHPVVPSAARPPITAAPLSAKSTSSSSSSGGSQHRNMKSSQPSSPVINSPTDSEWGNSAPPSRAPSRPSSQPASRAPSMSGGVSGNKIIKSGAATPKSRAPSVHSEKEGGGHKFNLKDLLANTPKLHRRSSQRSTSSRRSDSDAEGPPSGKAKSTAGDSAVSLSKKYGVCQKVAIGKGATSVVRLAHKWDRSEEKLYAVKEFRKRRKNETEKEYVKKLTAEFCISSTLHHPNIVETVDLVQDENHNWCEVMEFCPGGDLYAAIKKGGMSPSEVECCFKQILNGVAYLHSQGVAHRDIKPENLFFDAKGHLKIGDYGASTVYRLPWEATVHMSTGLCGSEPYIAPEQFLGKPYDARLVDIWACGIVYYCLHFQELPWRAAQPASDQLYQAYANACANSNAAISSCPPTINNLSPRACRPVIRKMLEPDPRHRWTIEDVISHEWVKSVEVCHEVKEPRHVHVNAKALGLTYQNGV